MKQFIAGLMLGAGVAFIAVEISDRITSKCSSVRIPFDVRMQGGDWTVLGTDGKPILKWPIEGCGDMAGRP